MIEQLISLMKTCVSAADEIAKEHRLGSEDKSKLAMTLFLEASRRNAVSAHPVQPSAPAGNSETATTQQATDGNGGNGNGAGRITSRQLAAIFAIGKSKGLTQVQIKAKVKQVAGVLPDYLSRQQASDCIGALQTLPDKGVR